MSHKLVLLLCLCVVNCSWFDDKGQEYTPQNLALVQPKFSNTRIFDPDNILLKREKLSEITYLMEKIKTDKNLDVYLYIISNISKGYGRYLDKNIKLFTKDLSYQKLNQDKDKNARSIFILFSINDRQSRIRTGSIARDYLSDSKAKTYLDSIKSELKAKNYDEAMLELITSIHDRVMIHYQFLSDLWDFIKTVALILILISVVLLILELFKFRLSATAETKLEKIKRITERGRPRKEFIETVCIICLEDLKKKEVEPKDYIKNKQHVHSNNGFNQNPPPSHDIPSLDEIQIKDERKNLNEINQYRVENQKDKDNKHNKENFIAQLECGHTFHSKCIAEWMVKQNKCPMCREKIDKEEDDHTDQKRNINNSYSLRSASTTSNSVFTRTLVNIQTSLHPELSRLDYTYSDYYFNWAFSSPSNTFEGSWDSSSLDSDSGGASSSW